MSDTASELRADNMILFRARANKRGFIRGGNWNNGTNAGAFTLNLNNTPTNTNSNIGFRVARSLKLHERLLCTARRECRLQSTDSGSAHLKDLPFGLVLAGNSAEDVQPARQGQLCPLAPVGLEYTRWMS
jgi:hypothetical protein